MQLQIVSLFVAAVDNRHSHYKYQITIICMVCIDVMFILFVWCVVMCGVCCDVWCVLCVVLCVFVVWLCCALEYC
jgi:hypothetical protein